MHTWINQVLSDEHASVTALIAVFVLGMISVVTCACNFAILGVVAGYSGASASKAKPGMAWLQGITFLAGGVISMAIIGALLGYASSLLISSIGSYWKIAAGLISIFFGIWSMDLLPFRLPGVSISRDPVRPGILSSILFGLAVGGLSVTMNSCCNPIFPVILAASFVKGSAAWGLMMLTAFGLGYGLPLAAAITGIGLGAGKLSASLGRIGTIIKYAGGVLLIVMGFYFLISF